MIRHAREGNAGGARGPGGPAEETYVDMVVERREITALNVLCFVKQGGTEEMVRRKVVCERLMKMEAVGLETGGKLAGGDGAGLELGRERLKSAGYWYLRSPRHGFEVVWWWWVRELMGQR
jgi:hypothetical protein